MLRVSRAVPATLALLAVCACGPTETVLVPRHRFVDAAASAAEQTRPATATIRSETRSVLRAYPSTRLFTGRVEVPADGRVSLKLPVPPGFRAGERLLLDAQAKPARGKRRYRRLGSSLAVVPGGPAARVVEFEFQLDPGSLGGRSRVVKAFVDGIVPPPGGVIRFETREVEVPPRAVLEFGLGVLEAAWGRGPVSFEVLACADATCSPVFQEVVDPAGQGGGWRDRRVPLPELAGATRRFVFEARPLANRGAGFSLPLWSSPTLLASAPRAPGDLNLILISLDTLRADHLTSYGYPRDTAPFLHARLVEGGTVFETAISAATTTAPSHATLFTSLQPSVHGVHTDGTTMFPEGAVTLADTLRAHGFATGAVTEGGALLEWRGFGRGFDVYARNPVPIPHRARLQSEVTFSKALAWIDRSADQRFFLFVHTYEVHAPYEPPPAYTGFFPEPSEELAPHPDLTPERDPLLYDREIRYLDDQLRALVEALNARGLLEKTLLVITSDHGEEFYEHGFWGHGPTPYEEVLRVPLVFYGAGVPPGRRLDPPVGLVDLMPTLLELAGVPAPDGAMGRSFAGMLRGEAPPPGWEQRPIFSEAWLPWGIRSWGREDVQQPTLAVRAGSRKLVRFRDGDGYRYEYFDLDRDPGERTDRYAREEESARDLRKLLDGYESALGPLRASLRAGGTAPGAQGHDLDLEQQESLRALGYLE
jgi:arylsulfatase A-like enzyme